LVYHFLLAASIFTFNITYPPLDRIEKPFISWLKKLAEFVRPSILKIDLRRMQPEEINETIKNMITLYDGNFNSRGIQRNGFSDIGCVDVDFTFIGGYFENGA